MKPNAMVPTFLLASAVLVACANDKPANSATSETTTTSARAPDGLMSSNANDTNATGAATNTSPDPTMSTSTPPTTAGANNVQNTPNTRGSSDSQIPQTRAHATSGHDATWGGGTTTPSTSDGNAAGASQAPATTAPPPPNNAQAQNGGAAPTPIDQGNNLADLKVTQQIRKAIVGDSSLSFTAKNVKIITQNGRVTLRGQVKSDDEKKWVEATAVKVVGNANVDNQLQVKP
jgi:hyperosmotically inducible protein